MKTYIKHFSTFQKAMDHKDLKNTRYKKYRVIEGPKNNWSVVDHETAYNMNVPYWF